MNKINGYGTKLSISTQSTLATTAAAFTQVAGLVSLSGPESDAEDCELFTMDSTINYSEHEPGGINPGVANAVLAYDKAEAGQVKLVTAHGNRRTCWFKVSHPSTAKFPSEYFKGYVAGLGRAIERAGMMTRPVRIKVSGNPGF